MQIRFRRVILRQVKVHIAARDILRRVGRQERIDNHLHGLRLVNMETVGRDDTHLLVPIHLRVIEVHYLLCYGVYAHENHYVRCTLALFQQLADGGEHIRQYVLLHPRFLQGLFGDGRCLFLRGFALRIHPQAHEAAIVLCVVEIGEVISPFVGRISGGLVPFII